MNWHLSFLLLLILVSACAEDIKEKTENKYPNIVNKQTEIRKIVSKEVDDTFYVYIKLPKNYNIQNKRYPVLYLLDGDISFNLALSTVRYLQYGGEVPDIIIVAPGYGTMMSDAEINFRERDYTISKNPRFEGSGGAKNYIRFLKNELIPLIDANYATNDYKVINGYSLGGLFTINLLLEEPSLFDSYIAGSPYLVDDLNLLSQKISDISGFSAKKKLFVSFGELEDKERYHIPIIKILKGLEKFKEINVSFRSFSEATHYSSPSQSLVYGLKFSFSEY